MNNKNENNFQQGRFNDPLMSAALIANALEMFKVRKAYLELQDDETVSAEKIKNAEHNWDLYLDTYCYAIKIIDKSIQ